MAVKLRSIGLPLSGQVEVDIRVSATVNISAFAARQKINGLLVDEISLNLHAGEPTLAVGDRLIWQAPIILSIPPRGDLGAVGELGVDVQTGEILCTRDMIDEIRNRARELAARPAPQAE